MVFRPSTGYYSAHPEKLHEFIFLVHAKHGDSKISTKAKNALLTLNEGFLVSQVTAWLKDSCKDFDECLQLARIAFLKAIENFKPECNTSIRTYAQYYLRDVKRAIFKKSKTIEFKQEYIEGFSETVFRDFRPFNITAHINNAITKLTSVEQQVITLHFLKGFKKKEIAVIRNCSEAYISKVVSKALPKLRTQLASQGITAGVIDLN